jgi:hypothetical protein
VIYANGGSCETLLRRSSGSAAGHPSPVEAARGLLHGAMARYLGRYLNVPPPALPGDSGEGLDDLPVAAEEIRSALLDTFDRQQQIGCAAGDPH